MTGIKRAMEQELVDTEEQLNLAGTEQGKRVINRGVEAAPINTQQSIKDKMVNPDSIVESKMRFQKAALTGQEPSLKDSFTEALTFFLPTAIGALGGALGGGIEGGASGAEAGTSLGAAFRSHQLKKEEMKLKQEDLDIKRVKANTPKSLAPIKNQQTDFTDNTGNPITFNPVTRRHELISGKQAKKGDFVHPIDERHAKNLERRDRSLRMADIKLKHSVAKDAQLSDKQVEKFESMTSVLDSIDRIDALQEDVATGLGRGAFQTLAEFADAAPKAFTNMKSETSSALAQYVKSISGAQVSELEAKRLGNIIPVVGDAPDVFATKLKTFRRIVKANKRAFKKAILSGQPLKKGTIIGLEKAEKEIQGLGPNRSVEVKGVSLDKQLDIIKRIKARRNK